jgi:hypothetical protein
MATDPALNVLTPKPRSLTIEDVHQLLGRYVLELELLRRENAALQARLENGATPADAS